MRLLIVDDDPGQLYFLEKSFISLDGYDTYSAYNADEAWEVYQTVPGIDVVITDYQCGGKKLRNGVELIQAIRKMNPHQHCILQTSERGTLLPGTPQLHKPFGIRQLMRLLRLPVQPLLPLQ